MEPEKLSRTIQEAIRKAGLPHTTRYVHAEDPQCEDDEIEIVLAGQPTALAVQLCMVGGDYSVNRYEFENGELSAVQPLGDFRSASKCAAAVVKALQETKAQ